MNDSRRRLSSDREIRDTRAVVNLSELDPIMRHHLEHVINSLVNITRGSVPRDQIQEVVADAYEEVAASAKIEQFIPILTMRQAQLLLEARQRQAGGQSSTKSVLLVCGTNAGRSQVGAALLRFYAPGLLDVVSAGQNPAEDVNENVVTYMREHGIELTDYPKRLRPEYIDVADHIIFVGSNIVEVPAGKDTEQWDVPHTSGLDLQQVKDAIHTIDDKARAFLRRILPDHELPPSIFEQRA